MPDRKQLTQIFILSAAGILAVLAVVGFFIDKKPELPTGPVVIDTSEAPEPEIVNVESMTPSPAPTESLPGGACTLLVDKQPVLTLASEDALRSLLYEYLRACATAPEGERFISAEFACELIPVPAVEGASLSDYDDALTLMINTPKTVPLRVTTEKLVESELPIETHETNSEALSKGCRIIKQLGFVGRSILVTERIYIAGELASEGEAAESEKHDGRALIVLNGVWTSRGDTPGRDEGRKGKDAGGLKLSFPMRGSVGSYFGMRTGKMHNGIDIHAVAGTAILSPGEGVVVYCGLRGAYGFVVDIDHGNGFISRLTHLDPAGILVEYNQRVFGGDQLGVLATRKDGKKPHLHYELLIDSIPYNPLFYMS